MNEKGIMPEINIFVFLVIFVIAMIVSLYPVAKRAYYAVDLNRAIAANDEQQVRHLIERGADPNWGSSDTTHLIAAVQKDRVAIAKILLETGADVNKKDSIGRTPLQQAKILGKKDMVRLLVDAGAHE